MVKYNELNARLTDTQLKKLQLKIIAVTTLRMNLKMFNGDNLSHKLLLITRQK